MLRNSLVKYHFKSDSYQLRNSFVNQIAQGDGSELSKSGQLATLRYESNKGSVEGTYNPSIRPRMFNDF